jgi:hypothetical protein
MANRSFINELDSDGGSGNETTLVKAHMIRIKPRASRPFESGDIGQMHNR